MKVTGIIPARYASTRLPAKALVDIGGKSMIRRVYEQCLNAKSLSRVVVATDDERILEHVQSFGGEVVMTSTDHQSGTDRCQEAYLTLQDDADYIINIQGDEPFIHPSQIDNLSSILDGQTELATLVKVVKDTDTLFNVNAPKVIMTKAGDVLYFSRHTLPYIRGVEPEEWLQRHTYYKHIGIYAYRADILAEITQLEVSSLEKAETLEQLRWLENGYSIKAVVTSEDSYGIDTPEDLDKVRKKFL